MTSQETVLIHNYSTSVRSSPLIHSYIHTLENFRVFCARRCCELEIETSTTNGSPLGEHRFLFTSTVFPEDPVETLAYIQALRSILLIHHVTRSAI